MQEFITVLIPMHNSELFIERCLLSLLNQTYHNLDIVVLDDGCTDNSVNIVEKFMEKDDRIRLIHKPFENNISLARNELLNNIKTDKFVWVDSDDAVEPIYIETLLKNMIEYDADMVACGYKIQFRYRRIKNSRKAKIKVYDKYSAVKEMTLGKNIKFMLWNKMFKKSLLNGAKFIPSVKNGEDFVFCMQYIKNCNKIVWINQKNYHYILRSTSEMHQKFSNKHMTFISYLTSLIGNEKDAEMSSTIKAWLCFSCCGFTFLANRKTYRDERIEMKKYANLYKKDLLKSKYAQSLYKFIARLALLTWCRYPKRKLATKLDCNA